MEYEWSIDPGEGIATVRVWGPFDLERSLAAPRRIASDPAFDPSFGVVVDLREIEYSQPAAEHVVALGQNLIGLRELFRHRVAVVVDGSHELAAELGAAIAGSGGVELGVFSGVDAARAWVSGDGSGGA